jgi:hypothetical protein
MPSLSPTAVFSEQEAAERLGVTAKWLAVQARAGRVPFVRLGRYRKYTDEQVGQILADNSSRPGDKLGRSARSRKGKAA